MDNHGPRELEKACRHLLELSAVQSEHWQGRVHAILWDMSQGDFEQLLNDLGAGSNSAIDPELIRSAVMIQMQAETQRRAKALIEVAKRHLEPLPPP